MFYIYMILNKFNDKKYIGLTIDLERRWREHWDTAYTKGVIKIKTQRLIHKALAKYGKENFSYTILQVVNTYEEAISTEKFWIAHYKTNVRRYGKACGYNLTDGGEGGCAGIPLTEIHKQRIGAANKGKVRNEAYKLHLSKVKTTLPMEALQLIRELLINNISTYEIGKMFNISQTVICTMKLGKSHRFFFTPEDIELFKCRRVQAGERNPSAKLTEQSVREIKHLLIEGINAKAIAKIYHVGESTIGRIKHGKSWAHIKI